MEVQWQGADEWESAQVRDHMIQALQNIVACNLKEQNYADALPAVNEILRLDPKNRIALIRRAKAISMPNSATIADYRQAIQDLEKLAKTSKDSPAQDARILKEVNRIKDKLLAVQMSTNPNTEHQAQHHQASSETTTLK